VAKPKKRSNWTELRHRPLRIGQAYEQKQIARRGDRGISEGDRAFRTQRRFDSNLAYAYAASGRNEEALKILADLESRHEQNPSADANIALIYVGLGDRDQAMAWLNKAYEAAVQSVDPTAAGVRSLAVRCSLPGSAASHRPSRMRATGIVAPAYYKLPPPLTKTRGFSRSSPGWDSLIDPGELPVRRLP